MKAASLAIVIVPGSDLLPRDRSARGEGVCEGGDLGHEAVAHQQYWSLIASLDVEKVSATTVTASC